MEILIRDKAILIDDEDYHKISCYRVYFSTVGTYNKVTYALCWSGDCYVGLMHRLILGLTDRRIVVDHQNHNGLDNRKSNLRVCSMAENLRNRRKNGNKKLNLPKGVTFRNPGFRAELKVDGARVLSKTYKTIREAEEAYGFYSKKYHKGFGCT